METKRKRSSGSFSLYENSRQCLAKTADKIAKDQLHFYPTLTSYVMHQEKRTKHLMEYSGWSRPWVENLWAYCSALVPAGEETIPRYEFNAQMIEFFGLHSGIVVERTFDVFTWISVDNRLTPGAFFKGVCILLTSNMEQKIQYVFSIYDMNFDGEISFSELAHSLRDTLVEEDFDAKAEGMKEIIEIVQKFLDVNTDGTITLGEFRERVYENELLLEILGQCLPDESHKEYFYDLISPKNNTPAQIRHRMLKRTDNMEASKKKLYPFLLVPPSKSQLRGTARIKCTRML